MAKNFIVSLCITNRSGSQVPRKPTGDKIILHQLIRVSACVRCVQVKCTLPCFSVLLNIKSIHKFIIFLCTILFF